MSGAKLLLAAGGTGGHLFPAEALAHVLSARGCEVHLVSDARIANYTKDFPAREIHMLPAGTVTGRSWLAKGKGAVMLARGYVAARRLLKKLQPDGVVGFGGYPTVPPLLAAAHLGIPAILHEQNAVMGRANRFLAPRMTAVATGFPQRGERFAGAAAYTGNPVRPAVVKARGIPYPQVLQGGALRLLVFGGSQGARVMSDVVPAAVAELTQAHRARMFVTQQVRDEDFARVRGAYDKLNIKNDVWRFFEDMPARIAASHLVIARAGASTIAELSVIGRPSILVPLPHALDQDQAANARVLAHAGAAKLVPQAEFTVTWLSRELARRLDDPLPLASEAEKAKAAGIPDAAEKLADLVLETFRNPA